MEALEPANPKGLKPGLRYSYVEVQTVTCPDFSKLEPDRTGIVPSFDLSEVGNREDNWAVMFSGYIEVPVDGVFTFYTASDDGSLLFVDDKLVVDNDRPHPVVEEGGQILLKKGMHPIRVVFFEEGGVQSLVVSYEGPDISKKAIPSSVLFYQE